MNRRLGGSHTAVSSAARMFAFGVTLFVVALAVVVFPQRPAAAAPPASAAAAADLCSIEQWQVDIAGCIAALPEVAAQRAQCLKAPPPDTPDSGLGGWFASRSPLAGKSGIRHQYTDYAYAGYSYTTYDIGCAPTLMHPDYKFENTVANGELMIATLR
jgi:hypothetical protein